MSPQSGNTLLYVKSAPFASTSNDLLFQLDPAHPRGSGNDRPALNYEVVSQDAASLLETGSAPAISMGTYLHDSGQLGLITTISIYSRRGHNRENARLLYMNDVAMRIWRQMGNIPRLIGSLHRPPQSAELAFGVPFSS